MKIISLIPFDVVLCSRASTLANTDLLKKYDGEKVIIENGNAVNMPKRKEGIIYLVNAFVFSNLKEERDDLAMFDQDKTIRDDRGLAIAQGGFIYSSPRQTAIKP